MQRCDVGGFEPVEAQDPAIPDLTVECRVRFGQKPRRGRRRPKSGQEGNLTHNAGRVPRLTRLMALAIRFERLVREGQVDDYSDLARLGFVSRARVTQIMGLLNLAPDIQEEILMLPRTVSGRDALSERHVREIAGVLDWTPQRRMWQEIKSARSQEES